MYSHRITNDTERSPSFDQIKQKVQAFLKPNEALKHIKDELDFDTLVELNLILQKLINKIKAVEQAPQLSIEEEEIVADTFIAAMEEVAHFMQIARDKIKTVIPKKKARRNLDLYLQAIQLHLQNHAYYQSIGIDFFNDDSHTGRPANLFSNIGHPWYTSRLSDYTYFASSTPVFEPTYITPEIIDGITELSIVYVTVVAPNPHGHILLGLGDKGFIHVNSLNDRPQYLSTDQFNDYLHHSVHMVLGIQHFHVPNMEGAKDKLRELSSQPWLWLMYRHNCNNFADAVLHAGGIPYAHIDPSHVGNYHHHTQYPVKRLACANPTTLNKTQFDRLNTEEKISLESQYDDDSLRAHYFRLGKNAGFNDEKARAYAHYRIDEGLSNKRAQYKVEPSFMNFLAMHHNKITVASLLHPLLFVLTAPLLVATVVKSLAFHVNCFFHPPEKQRYKEGSVDEANCHAEPSTLRPA